MYCLSLQQDLPSTIPHFHGKKFNNKETEPTHKFKDAVTVDSISLCIS